MTCLKSEGSAEILSPIQVLNRKPRATHNCPPAAPFRKSGNPAAIGGAEEEQIMHIVSGDNENTLSEMRVRK
jgi:hypothetical protein